MELNDIIAQRKEKLRVLQAKGISLHGGPTPDRIDIGLALKDFQENRKVSLSGRITAKRLHGKAIFADLKDSTGKIQLYFKSDFVGQEKFEIIKEDIDIANSYQL